MSAPGGAIYMGAAFHILAGGLREALALSERIGLSSGSTSIKDVPVLIKMLSVETDGIAVEAHKMLAVLAGRDLGLAPGPWEAWWAEHSRILIGHETDCRKAAELLHGLRSDVLTGRWPHVHQALSAPLRDEASAEALGRKLEARAPVMRKAYRDAEVVGLRLEGERAGGTMVVDWGAEGFALTELPIVREGGGWKFAALPWADELIVCPPRELHPAGGPVDRRRRRPSIFISRLTWKTTLVAGIGLLVLILLVVLGKHMPTILIAEPWSTLIVLGLALVLPGTLLYVILIRPLPNSRELRKRVRKNRERP